MSRAPYKTRVEEDSMGRFRVPAEALYGAQTARAVENFPISGQPLPPELIRALGLIKLAAAWVNRDLGKLSSERADAIEKAAREVVEGRLDAHFPVDVFQTGSGTSSNMNVNEVIANRANLLLGGELGARAPVHPNDHVNLGQSSNDVFPSAIHLAAVTAAEQELLPAFEDLHRALTEKAQAFDGVVKIARTHLQDAVPIRLGQSFGGYAAQIASARERIEGALPALRELALGGTAVGTGLNTHPEFGARMAEALSALTGLELREASNHFAAQASQDPAVAASGALRSAALALSKIANDLRWLGSGPRLGLGELKLPAVQPGSSIMPGKVNPVIAEAVIMACAQVLGNDVAIAQGGLGGVLELNTMLPLIARNLLENLRLLARSAETLSRRLIAGLEADREAIAAGLERSLSLATALAPHIGYDAAAAIAKEAERSGRTVREVAQEREVLPAGELAAILDVTRQTEPG